MKRLKDKIIYILSIALFSVSLGYYVFFFLYSGLMYFIPIRIKILHEFVHKYYFSDVAIGPLFICFGLTIVLSVLLIVGFRKNLRGWKDYFFTACVPLVLLAYYAVLISALRITEGLPGNWHETIIYSISFVLIVAYMVGFYIVMHRIRKRWQAEKNAESP